MTGTIAEQAATIVCRITNDDCDLRSMPYAERVIAAALAEMRLSALQEAMRAVENVLMFDNKRRAQQAIAMLAPGQIEEKP